MITFEETDKLTVKGTSKIVIKKEIEIVGIGTLPYEMVFNFENIPEEHHYIYLQMINTL